MLKNYKRIYPFIMSLSLLFLFLGCSIHPKEGDIYKSKIDPERRIRIVFVDKSDNTVGYEVVSESETNLQGESKRLYDAMKETADKLPGYPYMKIEKLKNNYSLVDWLL